MCIERKAPVQKDTEKTWGDVNTNFLITNEEGRFSSAVIGPSWKKTYLAFVSIEIKFPFHTLVHHEVNYWLRSNFGIFFLVGCSEDWDVISK